MHLYRQLEIPPTTTTEMKILLYGADKNGEGKQSQTCLMFHVFFFLLICIRLINSTWRFSMGNTWNLYVLVSCLLLFFFAFTTFGTRAIFVFFFWLHKLEYACDFFARNFIGCFSRITEPYHTYLIIIRMTFLYRKKHTLNHLFFFFSTLLSSWIFFVLIWSLSE